MKAYIVFWKEQSNLEEEFLTIHRTFDCLKAYVQKNKEKYIQRNLITCVTLNKNGKTILSDNESVKVFDIRIEELIQYVNDIFHGQHAISAAAINAWTKYNYNTLNYRMSLKN